MLKVESVKYYQGHTLLVELSDGSVGYFDVTPYLDKGIFSKLKDVSYFQLVKVNFCGIVWPEGQDFSADTISFYMQQSPNF